MARTGPGAPNDISSWLANLMRNFSACGALFAAPSPLFGSFALPPPPPRAGGWEALAAASATPA